MEQATRVLTNQSTKSYLERELIVSLDNDGPMIGPTLEMMDTHLEEEDHYSEKKEEEEQVVKKRKKWWKPSHQDATSDPRNFSKTKKNTILFLIATGGAISPVASTIYYPALLTMQSAFQTSDTTMNASVSIFTFFTAFFPLIWATFGDLFGRRKIYIISFFLSFVGSLCCALSVNVEMFIVFRAFSAIGSSSAMSMGAGTISDIFGPESRGRAFAYYTCGPLLGPALGPIIGGYLNEGLGWRSNFFFLAIYCLLVWAGICIFLPETWRPDPVPPTSTLTEKELSSPTKSSSSVSSTCSTTVQPTIDPATLADSEKEQPQKKKKKIVNPLAALELFKFPNIAMAICFIGVLFFVLYLNSTNFTRIYSAQYMLSSGTVGLCYLPSAVGSMVGGIAGGRMSDRIYNARVTKAKENEQEIYPEMRLGGPLFYGSLGLQLCAFTAYGWCVEKDVHFAYGLICQFFLGLSLMLPNVTLSAYMVDCFRKKGASVTACNNFVRYIMAGIGSLIASDILKALGAGILFTVCGALLLLATVNLLIIKKYTKKWALLRSKITC